MVYTAGCGGGEDVQAQKTKRSENRKVNNVSTENENQMDMPVGDVKFTSEISKTESGIRVKYSVRNSGGRDIYVLDAYPSVDMASRTASAETKSFYLCLREPATAFVLRGIPPLPSMPVNVRVMPLGTKLEQNGSLAREFNIPLPLRERSDWYYAPLAPEEYLDQSVNHISLAVQFIRSTVENFEAKPADYAPDFFIVNSKNIVGQTETLKAEFTIEKTQLFVRKDLFPRK